MLILRQQHNPSSPGGNNPTQRGAVASGQQAIVVMLMMAIAFFVFHAEGPRAKGQGPAASGAPGATAFPDRITELTCRMARAYRDGAIPAEVYVELFALRRAAHRSAVVAQATPSDENRVRAMLAMMAFERTCALAGLEREVSP